MDLSHHRSIFYCLFLAGPGGGPAVWWARGGAGVPGSGTWCTNPRKPLFFRPLCTKSPDIFGSRPPRTWCTDPFKPLFFRPLCTKSPDIFGPRPPRTWCTNSHKPLFFRPLCTKSPDIFGPRPPGIWCTNPRKPLFFRPLCTKSPDIFGPRPPRTWCTNPRKTLVLPSPLHQISGHFRPAAAVTFSKSKVDKCAIMLYHFICQLLQQTS